MCVLLARFGVEKKLLENSEKFTRFQRLFSGTAVYTIFATSLVVMFTLILIATFIVRDYYTGEQQPYYECVYVLVDSSISLTAVYFFAYTGTVVALFFSKVSDKLGIGTELKALATLSVLGGIFGVCSYLLIKDQGKSFVYVTFQN